MFLLVKDTLSFCPDKCDCDDRLLQVTCINTDIEAMPMTLNPDVQYLHLKNNKIQDIGAGIRFYPSLVSLDISGNHVTSIPNRIFTSQHKMRKISMRSNKISQIGNSSFYGLKT